MPPLLILGGISGAGMTTFIQDYRLIFTTVTFAFLGAAFYLTYRPRRNSASEANESRSPVATVMTFNKIMLWAVTVLVVMFLFFPQLVTNALASNDEFTDDMQRTVIQIEGMT